MYVLHVRRFANTHVSCVNSFLFTMKFLALKLRKFYSCFVALFQSLIIVLCNPYRSK